MECGRRTLGKTNRTWVDVLSKEKHYTRRQCANFLYISKNVAEVTEVTMSQNVKVLEYVTKKKLQRSQQAMSVSQKVVEDRRRIVEEWHIV